MYRLLIVDDEEIEREGMAHLIPWEQYGIEMVGTAWNDQEAMEKIKKEKPDIVMTDIKMPVMTGIELVHEAKKEFPEMEFIILSGYGEYEFTSQAMEEGIRHYLLKPCDESQIMKVMERVKEELEQKKREKEEQYREIAEKMTAHAQSLKTDREQDISGFVDYRKICESEDYGEVLFELYLAFVKMDLEGCPFSEKEQRAAWLVEAMCEETPVFKYSKRAENRNEDSGRKERSWELLVQTICCIDKVRKYNTGKRKEGQRMKEIFLAVFRDIGNQELSIQYLAKEVLYINEEYLGRVFARNREEKFSSWLLRQRILLAQRLIEYQPDMKIAQVAELAGYAPDGQYFSRAFRKITGMSPTEYRKENLQ